MRPQTGALSLLLCCIPLAWGCSDDDESTPGATDSGGASDVQADTGAPGDVQADTGVPTDTGGADGGTDALPDLGEATGAYAEAKGAPVDETLALAGLRYPVHVRRDEIGIPHVLAESVEDVFFAQGFVHARDRFPQMQIFRLATSGRLSALAGVLSESIVEGDIFVRVMGYNRMARAIYDGLDEGSLERRAVDAYAAGVNAFIGRFRAGEESVPPPLAVTIDRRFVEDWTPWDGLSIIRFQQESLGFDGDAELSRTLSRMAAAAVFDPDSDDPDLAARAGILGDLAGFAPADPTYVIPGFEPPSKSSGTRGLGDSGTDSSPAGVVRWRPPARAAIDAAIDFLGIGERGLLGRLRRDAGFSNSWVLSGELTATGNPMLANDPHLGLDSPTVFHQIHLVVEPRTSEDGVALNVYGIMFPGLPGVLIGHNERVAWGFTTVGFDYSDAYVDQLVRREGEEFPRVLRNGEEVELEIFEEEIPIGALGDVIETVTVQIPWVPGRGPLVPEIEGRTLRIPEGDEAISFAWRGFHPSNEIVAVLGFGLAQNADDLQAAMANFTVGTQNLLGATVDGDIVSTPLSYVPVRPAAAQTWDPVTNPDGVAPWWTLSGTGEHDWLDEPLDPALLPQVVNPEVGFIVAANNDQRGETDDGHPLNDGAYIGYDWAPGFRAGRITDRLTNATGEWPEGHLFTLEEVAGIQADVFSTVGERLVPFFLEAMDAALEEYDNAGTHPDVGRALADHAGDENRVQALRDLLAGWDLEAEDGIRGEPTEAQRESARATSLFNVWLTAVLQAWLGDEQEAAPDMQLSSTRMVVALIALLEHPEEAATYSETTGDSILWDDLSTEAVETRYEIIVSALFDADAQLAELFGSSAPADWLWGELHTRTFEHQVPDASDVGGGMSPYDVPPTSEWPNGFPRPGDNHNVARCDGGVTDFNYRCGGGATLLFAVELDPQGVRGFNALPGGQIMDHRSPHFRDMLDDYWLNFRRFAVRFHPDDVAAAEGEHLLLLPE